MVFSQSLAERVRFVFTQHRGVTEKRMFGGIGFLRAGHMVVAVWQSSLIVRLGIPAAEKSLTLPGVRPFDVTGKPMKGWAMIEPDGLDSDRQLEHWIEQAMAFVRELPPKID